MAHNLIAGLLLGSRKVGRGGPGEAPSLLLRCARGPERKPIKVRFMFIKCLSKLKNFLINSNLASAPSVAGRAASAPATCLLTTLG